MKGLRITILLAAAAFMSASLLYGLDYDILHTNTSLSYKNSAAFVYSNELSFTNDTDGRTNVLAASERAFSHYKITLLTNNIYKGLPFSINIKAVDSEGGHVTITQASNITLTNYSSSGAAAASALSVGALSFTSPTVSAVATNVDLFGTNITNITYPTAENIYIDIAESSGSLSRIGLLTVIDVASGYCVFDYSNYIGMTHRGLITLYDVDKNTNLSTIDSAEILLYSDDDAVKRSLVLYEKGTNSGEFTNVFGFASAFSSNDIIRAAVSDNSQVYAEYTDDIPAVLTTTSNAKFSSLNSVSLTNPLFINYPVSTNVDVWALAASGLRRPMNSEYTFSSILSNRAEVTASNEIRTKAPGLGFLKLSNVYDNQLSTNLALLIALSTSQNHTFTNASLKLAAEGSAYSEDTFIDVRRPDEYSNYYEISNMTGIISTSSNSISDGLLFSNSFYQITAMQDDLNEMTNSLSSPISITFSYASNDMTLDGERITESAIKIVRLKREGSSYSWEEIASTVDQIEKTVSAEVYYHGVYALKGKTAKMAEDLTRTGIYPNPADFRESEYMNLMNLPEDTTYVRIYDQSGRVIKTFNSDDGSFMFITVGGVDLYGLRWDGRDRYGSMVRSGLYFMEIKTPSTTVVKKFGVKK